MSQAVRDLLWAINTPSFVTGTDVAPPRELDPATLDADHLERFLAERREHRVGRYFEHLLHYWLAHIRKVEIVGAGLQIRDGKRTVGELDFLFRDEDGALVHCEAAVKFFLHHPRDGVSHYPGPNATDNFELKAAKLFDQQLELSRHHYPQVTERQAFVKGIVFYQPDTPRPEQMPARMSTDHQQGVWLRPGQLDLLEAKSGAVGCVCEKPHWLAARTMQHNVPMPTLVAQLRRHFETESAHPMMVSLCDPTSCREIERLFVVSDHWPR